MEPSAGWLILRRLYPHTAWDKKPTALIKIFISIPLFIKKAIEGPGGQNTDPSSVTEMLCVFRNMTLPPEAHKALLLEVRLAGVGGHLFGLCVPGI